MLWFYASGMFLLPALLPTPCHSSSCLAHGAAVTAQWIFFRVVFCQHGSCWVSVCQTCQEPVLGECWSCSSFSRACIFSCFLVTSSSLPTPGSPSGYHLPVLDGSGAPSRDGREFLCLSQHPLPCCHLLVAQVPPVALHPLSKVISKPGWDGKSPSAEVGSRRPHCSVSTQPG